MSNPIRSVVLGLHVTVAAGIGSAWIRVVSRGEMQPWVTGQDARSMALNRRVVLPAL